MRVTLQRDLDGIRNIGALLSTCEMIHYARSYWSAESLEQRTKNRKVWFDTKYPEAKNG
jgi:hypothetical protein